MDVPYLLKIPEAHELWIVDGERRFLITPKVYDLLVSNGAELPPAYGIEKLREQNDKLHELVRDMMQFFENGDCCDTCEKFVECEESETYESGCLMRHVFKDRMRELGVQP